MFALNFAHTFIHRGLCCYCTPLLVDIENVSRVCDRCATLKRDCGREGRMVRVLWRKELGSSLG
jgi:predicted amidophosphoribosyltransferase